MYIQTTLSLCSFHTEYILFQVSLLADDYLGIHMTNNAITYSQCSTDTDHMGIKVSSSEVSLASITCLQFAP